MDPITALGLASSVVQLIDFTSKLVKTSREIVESGSTASVTDLLEVTVDLVGITKNLKRRLQAKAQFANALSQEEEDLFELSEQCNQLANQTIETLKNFTDNNGKEKIWKSMSMALRTMWSKGQIDGLAARLKEYREQISFRLLLVLNAQSAIHDEKLGRLRQSDQEIVEAVSINCKDMRSMLREHHAETIAAILTTKDGTSTSLPSSRHGIDFTRQMSGPHIEQRATTFTTSLDKKTPASFEDKPISDFCRQILDALHFRTIAHRRATIPKAYCDTFEWVFGPPEPDISSTRPWSDVSEWLRSGQGCYWISGKAGSGKSSLMKFLQEDKRTFNALRTWSGDSEVVIGSFYFYYAGSALQKSQIGLLRSLLFDVLSHRPELISVVFPDLCRSIISGQLEGSIELSYVELKLAFAKLIERTPPDIKICFLVDGIDEYVGDHNEICGLFARVTAVNSIKILLSSRPIPSCVQAFSRCPNLRVQDLTEGDVQRYVQENLAANTIMESYEMMEPGITSQLVNEVTSKASGVFLWVILVVRKLIQGLQNFDSISDLRSEVERLPPDLGKLYDLMLGSVGEQNRRLGSKFLQLVLRSTYVQEDYPMSLLQLSFAEDEDYSKSINDPIRPLPAKEESWRLEVTEGRMRSRCCGLIEAQGPPILGIERRTRTVGFLHRTVVEFLEADVVWCQIISLTANTKFDADLALLNSSLSEMKTVAIQSSEPMDSQHILSCLYRMLNCERLISEHARHAFHQTYLPELRKTLAYHWHDKNLFASPKDEFENIHSASNRAFQRHRLPFPHSLVLSLGTQWPDRNLYRSLYTMTILTETDLQLHVAYLLIQYVEDVGLWVCMPIARKIMTLDVSPNTPITFSSEAKNVKKIWEEKGQEKFWDDRWPDAFQHESADWNHWTLWGYLLHFLFSIVVSGTNTVKLENIAVSRSLLTIVLSMLESGADVHKCITVVSQSHNGVCTEYRKLSPFTLIDLLMRQVWAATSDGRKQAGSGEIAGPACAIEDFMLSKEAQVTDMRLPCHIKGHAPRRHESRLAQKEFPPKNKLIGLIPRTLSKSKPTKTANTAAKKVVTSVSLQPEPTQARNSPWKGSKNNATVQESKPSSAIVGAITEGQIEKKWATTAPSRRIELLSSEEQELAKTLSRLDITAGEKRLAYNQMIRLPYDKQAKVLQCSRLLAPKAAAEAGSS